MNFSVRADFYKNTVMRAQYTLVLLNIINITAVMLLNALLNLREYINF